MAFNQDFSQYSPFTQGRRPRLDEYGNPIVEQPTAVGLSDQIQSVLAQPTANTTTAPMAITGVLNNTVPEKPPGFIGPPIPVQNSNPFNPDGTLQTPPIPVGGQAERGPGTTATVTPLPRSIEGPPPRVNPSPVVPSNPPTPDGVVAPGSLGTPTPELPKNDETTGAVVYKNADGSAMLAEHGNYRFLQPGEVAAAELYAGKTVNADAATWTALMAAQMGEGSSRMGTFSTPKPEETASWHTDNFQAPKHVAVGFNTYPPPGWDRDKWNDPNHQTPKYVVGRIIQQFAPDQAGFNEAVKEIQAAYPGTTTDGKDKITIPGVGTFDIRLNASTGGTGWTFNQVGS